MQLTKKINDIQINIRFFVKQFFFVFLNYLRNCMRYIEKTKRSVDSAFKSTVKSCIASCL